MGYEIVYPILYLIIGIAIGKSKIENFINIRWYASALLTRLFIPLVIIYNIAFHEPGVFSIMIAMMMIMAVTLFILLKLTKDPILSLCFCYLNIGWLGLPIGVSLYGDQAATVIIAAYIGSSIFGNSLGISALIGESGIFSRIKKTLRTPPVISLLLGFLLMPFASDFKDYVTLPYAVSKISMSFLGMAVLGIWMSNTALNSINISKALAIALIKALILSMLITLLVIYGIYFDVRLITDNIKSLYLIALLPPAANIIALETYYLKTGRSAAIITTGTIISLVLIFLYALITKLLI